MDIIFSKVRICVVYFCFFFVFPPNQRYMMLHIQTCSKAFERNCSILFLLERYIAGCDKK